MTVGVLPVIKPSCSVIVAMSALLAPPQLPSQLLISAFPIAVVALLISSAANPLVVRREPRYWIHKHSKMQSVACARCHASEVLRCRTRPSSSRNMFASICGTPISIQYQFGFVKLPCSQYFKATLAETSSELVLAVGVSGDRTATAMDWMRRRCVVAAHVPRDLSS